MRPLVVALVPTRTAHEQLRVNLADSVEMAPYLGTVAEISTAVQSGAISFERTDAIVVADCMPGGVPMVDGTSHLSFAIANVLRPEGVSVEPTPVIVVGTDASATATLVADVARTLDLQPDGSKQPVPGLHIVGNDLREIHAALGCVLPDFAGAARPANRLLLTAEVEDVQAGRVVPAIAVTSAKGGAGKTTSTIMLAFAAAYLAAQAGRRMNVVILELDLTGAVSRSLVTTGRKGADQRTVIEYVNTAEATEAALFANLETIEAVDAAGNPLLPEGAVRILFGPRRTMDAPNVTVQHVQDIIGLLRRSDNVDLILIDTSADVADSPILAAAFHETDHLLYVIEDKPTSYAKMAETLTWLQTEIGVPVERMKIVVNKALRETQDTTLRDDLMRHNAGVAALGVIPQSGFLHSYDGADATGSMWRAFFLEDETALSNAFRSLTIALLPAIALRTAGTAAPASGSQTVSKRGWFRRGKS